MAVKERRAQVAQNPRRLPMWVQTTLRVFEGPAAKLGLALLIIMLILCLGAPLFTHYSINDMDLLNMHAGPSKEHLLGTDRMGRDLWTLLLYGGRTSIALGILGSLFAAVGGTVVGLVSGYLGGQADNLIILSLPICRRRQSLWPRSPFPALTESISLGITLSSWWTTGI